MDTFDWDLDFVYNGPKQSHISCYIGEFNPLAFCNIIGNQPLFYMNDSADEEDEFIDDIEFLETISQRIESYDKSYNALVTDVVQPTEGIFDRFFTVDQAKQTTIKDIKHMAEGSFLLETYMDIMESHNIVIVADEASDGVIYNRQLQSITFNPFLSVERTVMQLASAMRQAFLHKNGALINPLRFQPEDAVLINRLQSADQKIATIEIAWELRLSGHSNLWDIMMDGADRDICTAYGVEAMSNFRSLKNGLAARSAFEKWFISSRCKTMDRNIIQIMLGNKIDLIFNDTDTSRLVATDLVAKMGLRPVGKNYLSTIITQIMVDSLYTDVRDRSNANFLWFITFEKKMNEMEQELQGELQTDDKSVTTSDHSKGNHANASGAPITKFPDRQGLSKNADTDQSAEGALFYLDHFRAL
jgi:hypothetical protein